MNSRSFAIAAVALACGGALSALGQRVSFDAALHTADKPYVQATGEATVTAKPDQAIVEIGVETQAQTAPAAAAENAKQTDAVLADLRKLLSASDQLRTTNYSVRPNFQYPKPGSAPVITGFIATNIVEVTLDDLTQLSKVIDRVTQSGANIVQKLQYRLKNSGALRERALREASAQARTSAEAIASGLGLQVVGVLSAEEFIPEEGFAMHKAALPVPSALGTPPATPVEVGMIEVDATVILRVEVGPKG